MTAAAWLSQNGGTFPARLLGETGSLKLDRVLAPHQSLSARLSTARSYGMNNVSFDSGSPITNYAMSGNGKRVGEFVGQHYAAADEPSAGAVFA
jgi:hypothetical protein